MKEMKLPEIPNGNPYLKLRCRRDEKDENYKTAFLLADSIIPQGVTSQVLGERIAEKTAEIPNNRPVENIGSPSASPLHRPAYIITPNGSKLMREKCYGFLLIYSNKKIDEVVRGEVNSVDAKVEEILKNPPEDYIKRQTIFLTPELLDSMKEIVKIEKRGTNGIPDQNSTMAKKGINKQEASATKIATRLGIRDKDELFEWLHLIAYILKGRLAQTSENMTGGTKAANTDMIFAENEVVYTAYREGEVYLKVMAEEFPGTHFAKKITYTIMTKKCIIPFEFDAQTCVQPSYKNQYYIHAVVETILELTGNLFGNENSSNEVERKFTSKRRIVFQDDSSGESKKSVVETELMPGSEKAKMPRMFFSASNNNAINPMNPFLEPLKDVDITGAVSIT